MLTEVVRSGLGAAADGAPTILSSRSGRGLPVMMGCSELCGRLAIGRKCGMRQGPL